MVMVVVMMVIMTVAMAMIMSVPMRVIMRMSMTMGMAVMMIMRLGDNATFAGAKRIAELTVLNLGSWCGRPHAFNVMVVTFLGRADFIFEAQDLRPILAHGAVHLVLTFKDLRHTLREGCDHLRMVVEIPGLDELNVRIAFGHDIREAIDAVNEDPGEEEVGKHDDAFVAKPCDVFEARLDQWERHT